MFGPPEGNPSLLGRRFRCAVPVTLRKRSQDVDLLTSDVSFKGAFVRSHECPPKNSLVRLVFTLPPDGAKLTVSGAVLHVVSGAEGNLAEYPGFAVGFLGFSGPPKERWDEFVLPLSRQPGAEQKGTMVFARPSYVERFRRTGPPALDLDLRPTPGELDRLIDQTIPTGTLFVPTDMAVVPGANVSVRMIHPMTLDVFPLPGTARRQEGATTRGVDVTLAPLTGEVRAALLEFRDAAMILEDYDIEILEAPTLGR
jgi:hypothetical protein